MEQRHEERYDIEELLSSRDGVLRVGEARAVVLTEAVFVQLLQVIHENQPELVTPGFYEMGYRAGRELVEKAARPGDDPEQTFRFLVETYKQSGYGDIEFVCCDFAAAEAEVHGHRLLETGAARQSGIYRTPRAVDHFSRGMLAGLFSQLLGREVSCEELACEFRGDDACVFRLGPYGVAG